MNQSLHKLFVQEIQDLYSGELQIIEAMPKMIETATDPTLKQAFENHLQETKDQVKMLDKLCGEMGIDPEGKHCLGMEGIITEGEETFMELKPSMELDQALIANAQKVEHYEIAGYGTAANFAQVMGHTEAQDILHTILQEEKATDERLSALADKIFRDDTTSASEIKAL